jgi:prophage regulatory protein
LSTNLPLDFSSLNKNIRKSSHTIAASILYGRIDLHKFKGSNMDNRKEKFIRINTVMDRTGLEKSTVWDFVKKNKLPKPIKLSTRVTVWLESEIDQFIQTKKNERQ